MKVFTFLLILFWSGTFAQTVYRTPSGTKYHLGSCRMVKNVSNSLSISKARNIGLAPCGICHPPSGTVYGLISPTKKVQGTNAKNRCRGTTKKGTRCKHYTAIGNDYCYQHLR